jgi:hypothetical protein
MTEYVIIIPFVLLIFFAALQTMLVAQAAQLANYAAFVGARSYATKYSQYARRAPFRAHKKATRKARIASTLVMAPVSHAVPGESIIVFRALRRSADRGGAVASKFYSVLEGFVVALVFRIDNYRITRPRPNARDDDAIIVCRFDYYCPLAVPGLAEMWDFIERNRDPKGRLGRTTRDFKDSFEGNPLFLGAGLISDALEGLSNIFGTLSHVLQFTPASGALQTLQNFVNGAAGLAPLGARSNVRIRAKCAIGFEPWRGKPQVPGRWRFTR